MRGEFMDKKNLEQKIVTLSKNYLSIQKAFLTQTVSNKYEDMSNPFVQFCYTIEQAFYSLSSPLRKIINNEFFYQEYKGWWKDLYSEKQFKRLRKLAIYRFMEAYYEEI